MSDSRGAYWVLRGAPYFLFFIFYWVTEALFVPYLGLYFKLRGMDSVQIGMLNAMFYVVTILSAVSIGYAADRLRRPRLTVCICYCFVILVVLYMSRASTLPHLAAAYSLYGYFVVSCCDLVDKLLLERLGDDTRYFGLFRVGSPLGYSGGAVLAGFLIPRFGVPSLFPICMAFAALCVAMALLMKESTAPVQTKKVRVPVKQLFTSRSSAYIYGTMVLWGFSESGSLTNLAVYMSDRGFSTEYTSVLITIAMVGQTVAFSLMPMIQSLLRPKTMVLLGFAVFSGRILSLALIGEQYFPFLLVAVFHFVGGCAQAFILTPITLMIGRSFSPEVSSTAQTMKTVASKGIGSSTGAFLYGWLYSRMPGRSVMLLFACLILCFGLASWLGGVWIDRRSGSSLERRAQI